MERKLTMAHHPAGAGKSSFDLIDGQDLIQRLALEPDLVFLDLGCGRGNYTFAAAEYIGARGTIHAVDMWAEGVAAVEERARSEGLTQIRAHRADAGESLPLADATVDLCLMATVLHDLVTEGNHTGALEEISRVLKPGGRLAVVEFAKVDGPPGPPLHIRLAPSEVVEMLRPYGFSDPVETILNPNLYLAQFQLSARPTERSTP
jgi:ubiquinone/menaquinone biosynthesis C-methylase UbiE